MVPRNSTSICYRYMTGSRVCTVAAAALLCC